MPRLTLIRGLPGSGKTTLAKEMKKENPSCRIVAADDFFGEDYKWAPHWAKYAHSLCLGETARLLYAKHSHVIVHNTFIRMREIIPYWDLAKEVDADFETILSMTPWMNDPEECYRRCTHNVPLEKIIEMKENMEAWHYTRRPKNA